METCHSTHTKYIYEHYVFSLKGICIWEIGRHLSIFPCFSFPHFPNFPVQLNTNVTLEKGMGQPAMSCVAMGLSARVFMNPEFSAIIPYGSHIYYIWNSVVFPFNTERRSVTMCPRICAYSWRLLSRNVKHNSHSMTRIAYIPSPQAVPTTQMTDTIIFEIGRI